MLQLISLNDVTPAIWSFETWVRQRNTPTSGNKWKPSNQKEVETREKKRKLRSKCRHFYRGKKISTLVRTFSRSNISIYIEVENNSTRELKTKLSRTPSIPRKSERLVRSSFFILRVEFNLLRGSTGRFSSSLMSTGGGGGFSFGGSTLVGGPRGNANPVTISSSLDRFNGKICRNKTKSLEKWKFITKLSQ